VINSSRAILYAGAGDSFAVEARKAALQLRDQIEQARRAAAGEPNSETTC